jgi:two-component system response regulator FimZ (fimbrial Z protein)/two-component system response regulator EvgA
MLQDQLLFEIAGQAQNGEECLRSIKEVNPNMLILDVDMPKTDGFDVIRRIGIMYPEIRILVLSSLDEAVYGGRVRSLGAHGLVNKTAGADVILAACVAISQGYNFFTHGKNGNSSLSDNQQISDILHISNKTVATYKTRVFDKLGINNIADLILFCRMNNIIES